MALRWLSIIFLSIGDSSLPRDIRVGLFNAMKTNNVFDSGKVFWLIPTHNKLLLMGKSGCSQLRKRVAKYLKESVTGKDR